MTDIIYRSKSALIQFISDNCTNLSASNNITAGFFYGDGSLLQNVTGSGGGGDPGGSTTQVQYNNAGSFAGSANLTFDGTDLTVGGDLTANGGDIYSIDASGGDLFLRRNDSSIVADEILGNIYFQATENGSDVSFGAAIRGVATEAFVFPDDEGTKLEFLTTENGSGLYAVNMTLHNDGVLQVGSIKGNTDNNLTLFSDASMYFDIDEDNDSASSFYWRNGGNTTVMELDESGNLQMDGDLTVDGGDIVTTDATGGDLFLRRNDSSIVADEVLGNVFFQATENGSDVSFGAAIRGVATETFVYPSAEGTKLEFLTTANGSGLYDVAMTLDGDGNLDIAGDLTVTGQNIKSPADLPLFFNTDKSMYFDIDEDNDETDQIFRWRAYSTTLMTLTEAADLTLAGDLTVSTAGSTIAQEAWTAVSYATGWADYSVSYLGVSYMKDSLGFIHIRGMAKKTSGGTGLVFTLPSGYRPANRLIFNVQYYDLGATAYVHGRVDVLTNGQVTVVNPTPGVNDWVSFGAINFDTRAEP